MSDFLDDVGRVQRIHAVPTILQVVSRTTGMRFAAIARVTQERWIACSVLDEIGFGIQPGGELKIETTICHEIQQSGRFVVINDVQADEHWRQHPTPVMYGFQSYISVPIVLADGTFFGTLCAIDPQPASLNTPEVVGMFRLFADLIAKHLDGEQKLVQTERALGAERQVGELREIFLAMLGHDLRSPLRAIHCLTELLARTPLTGESITMAKLIQDSAARMQEMVDSLVDLAHGRLGGGLPLRRDANESPEHILRSVIAEQSVGLPAGRVEASFDISEPVSCDRNRIAQLFSNLLGNALAYGDESHPVSVTVQSRGGVFELSVANAGEPIPALVAERLFQPFYRSAVHEKEGLGLGLYIANEIASAHGGTLVVNSTPEETRFTFRMSSNPSCAVLQAN